MHGRTSLMSRAFSPSWQGGRRSALLLGGDFMNMQWKQHLRSDARSGLVLCWTIIIWMKNRGIGRAMIGCGGHEGKLKAYDIDFFCENLLRALALLWCSALGMEENWRHIYDIDFSVRICEGHWPCYDGLRWAWRKARWRHGGMRGTFARGPLRPPARKIQIRIGWNESNERTMKAPGPLPLPM